jgi:tetratricopeptide (TPR) repeat protein
MNDAAANQQIQKGLALFNEAKYQEALPFFEKALSFNPKSVHGWNCKGACFYGLARYMEAIECYDKALGLDSKDEYALSNKFLSLLEVGKLLGNDYSGSFKERADRFEKALSFLQQALKIKPKDKNVLYQVGMVYSHQSKYEEAIKYLDMAIAIDPKFVDAWRYKGCFLGNKGENKEASKCFDHILKELDPNDEDVLSRKLNELEYGEKKYEEAIEFCSRLTVIYPTNKDYRFRLANLYFCLSRFEKATKHIRDAIKLDKNFVWAWLLKGRILYMREELDKAIECFDQVIALGSAPGLEENSWEKNYSGRAWAYKICILTEQGKLTLIEDIFRKEIAVNKSATEWQFRAVAFYHPEEEIHEKEKKAYRNPQHAIRCMLQASALDSNNILYLANLGDWFKELGDNLQALEYLDKIPLVVQSSPDPFQLSTLRRGLQTRAEIKINLNKPESAIKDLEFIIKLIPELHPDKEAASKEVEKIKKKIREAESLSQEKSKKDEFTEKLAELRSLRKASKTSLSELNRAYQELEVKALGLKSAYFYTERGDFYFETAEVEKNTIRRNTLYQNALQDFNRALNFDPFLDGAPEKIETIESKLKSNNIVGKSTQILLPAPKEQPLKREELTSEQLEELEKMKAQLKREKGL